MAPRILIVEDNLPLAQAMARLISRLNVSVDVSGDGIEGLRKYAADPYDLLVVDLHLPRLSGVELVRKIRSTARGKALPVIIVTGVYKGDQYAKKAREALAIKYYLEKPFSQEALLDSVKQSLSATLSAGAAAAPAAPAPAGGPRVTVVKTPPDRAAGTRPPAPVAREKPTAPAPRPAAPSAPAPGPKPVAEIQPRRALMGNLSSRPLDGLLLEAKKTRATGILFIKKGDDDRSLLFINGVPIGLSAAKLETSFGNWLFNQGKISLMEYQVYQGQQKNGADVDQIFIKMGALLPDEFFAEWKKFVEESLSQMFSWQDAEFTFQLWPPLPESSPLPPMNLSHIIHQGFKRFVPGERLMEVKKRASGRFVALTRNYYDHQMHISIEPMEALFLDRADGTRRFEELLPEAADDADKIMRSFAAFQALGMVELRDRPVESGIEAPYPIRERVFEGVAAGEEEEPEAAAAAPEPEPKARGFDDMVGDLERTLTGVVEEIHVEAPAAQAPSAPDQEQAQKEAELAEFHKAVKSKNYYEIFGLKFGNFDFGKLKEQYFKLTKQFGPEQFIMSSGDYLEKSEEALSIIATAYNTLSNVVSKEKYDEMLDSHTRAAGVPGAKDHDKMQAEVSFQSGMAFMEMGDWDGAEKSLSEAMSLTPDNAEIIAQYAYALYNKNRKSKVMQKRVQELLAQALKIKPRCAPAFAYRGALLLDDEKAALAEADFKKALSLNPRYRFALKGLKKIEQRQLEEKKGLFSRFRK
ncbi:MAG TPA: response regulator [bacterium]|nr:response regulator [bacterium]